MPGVHLPGVAFLRDNLVAMCLWLVGDFLQMELRVDFEERWMKAAVYTAEARLGCLAMLSTISLPAPSPCVVSLLVCEQVTTCSSWEWGSAGNRL